MNEFLNWMSQPWPWYVSGPLIGLMVPALLVFLNKPFGVSSSMRHVCAMCVPTKLDYFNYDWKKESWSLIFTAGVIGGAALVYLFFPNTDAVQISADTKSKLEGMGLTDFHGLLPHEVFNWNMMTHPLGWIMVVLGGFLVGFGTRYANGCTSGHAIMGLSMLNLGSLVATIGFFIGGLIVSWLVLPSIMSLL